MGVFLTDLQDPLRVLGKVIVSREQLASDRGVSTSATSIPMPETKENELVAGVYAVKLQNYYNSLLGLYRCARAMCGQQCCLMGNHKFLWPTFLERGGSQRQNPMLV